MAKNGVRKLIFVEREEIHLTYDVLRIIFQHLSFRDLTNVSEVSRYNALRIHRLFMLDLILNSIHLHI